MLLFELKCRIQHFFDRNQNLASQTRGKFAPRANRSGQNLFEEMIYGREISRSQHIAQRRKIIGKFGLPADILPQAAFAIPDIAVRQQLFLRPPDDGRDEQACKAEVVIRLKHKFDCRQQILHHQWLQKLQPIDARDRDVAFVQLRDQQRRHVTAAAQQEHDVARLQITPLAFKPRFLVDEGFRMIGQSFGQCPFFVAEPVFFLIRRIAIVRCVRLCGYGLQKLNHAKMRLFAVMRVNDVVDAKIGRPRPVDHGVYEIEYRRGRTETAR